jgi:hypothetical protein
VGRAEQQYAHSASANTEAQSDKSGATGFWADSGARCGATAEVLRRGLDELLVNM